MLNNKEKFICFDGNVFRDVVIGSDGSVSPVRYIERNRNIQNGNVIDLPDMVSSIAEIDIAAERVVKAIRENEVIGIFTDYDVDGATSRTVLLKALDRFIGLCGSKAVIKPFLVDRDEGYGLSMPAAKRIADDNDVSLLITADCGTADNERIAFLKEHGIDTIVTDHHDAHHVPHDAYAFVSPKSKESIANGADTTIAGVAVAWSLIYKIKDILDLNCRVSDLLDYVALGTVADCVSMATPINRAIVRYGLSLINMRKRPCWKAAGDRGWLSDPVKSSDIAFKVGPCINAWGRLDLIDTSVNFLMSNDYGTAFKLSEKLDDMNNKRKEVQKKMFELILKNMDDSNPVIVAAHEDGVGGVQGIVASKVVERFGKPAAIGVVSGDKTSLSFRTAHDIPLGEFFSSMKDMDWVIKAGGHDAAGGATIRTDCLELLSRAFGEYILTKTSRESLRPVTHVDAMVSTHEQLREVADFRDNNEPFGNGCPVPVVMFEVSDSDMRIVGKDENILVGTLAINNSDVDAVAFQINNLEPLADMTHVIGEPYWDVWNGNKRLKIMVRGFAKMR
ncbi:MAG: hypothetical protein D6732_10465 [Methanobacteriota archaeon]|nr:MAG: hypothetical protein D6732_10465 [Euryarchaeota archaeon]